MFHLFRRQSKTSSSDDGQLESAIADKELKRPPSLNQLSSQQGILRSIGSGTSLSSLGSTFSPNGSGNRSRRGSVAMFSRDNYEALLLRTFPYEEIDPGIDGVEHDGNFEFRYRSEVGEEIVDLIKIPISFLRIMRPLWRRHKIFATWRLGSDPFIKLNRRCSFSIDGEIIYDPKQTNTSTQTEGPYGACGGHIPESDKFRTKLYKEKDSNFAGSFHQSIQDQSCDEKLLALLQDKVSPDITEVKHFHNMICYSKLVEVHDKNGNSLGKELKHFIQEARSLFYVLEIIEKQIGLAKFIYASSNTVIFCDPAGNTCKLDLTQLLPTREKPSGYYQFDEFDDFKHYIQQHELEDDHAPLFYSTIGVDPTFVPVMNLSGKKGLPIAGDVDPENTAERDDAPDIVHKSFNGANDDPNRFIVGLKILVARLYYKTALEFATYLDTLKKELLEDDDLDTLNDYSDIFDSSQSEDYLDYTNDEYYQTIYLPIAEATLELYIEHPELLKTAGQSSIGCLVIRNDFDHEQYEHDADNLNMQPVLGPMGTTFFYYETEELPNGRLCITGNEETYVKFLLHDPRILANNRFGVHPSRLGDEVSGALWATCWLDIIRIQALHQLKKGPQYLLNYKKTLIADMQKRNCASEQIALAKINKLFDNMYTLFEDVEAIQAKIDFIHGLYEADSYAIKQKICSHQLRTRTESIFTSESESHAGASYATADLENETDHRRRSSLLSFTS